MAMRLYVLEKLKSPLRKIEYSIVGVRVCLKTEPHQKKDKQHSVFVEITFKKQDGVTKTPLVLSESNENLYAAIDTAMGKINCTIVDNKKQARLRHSALKRMITELV